ncbi:GNAT family N-acetyltransferase [Robiginitalea aurantiaca]|uniref:GNAT family N-acetyltransferase n=1 Tax=Robiginitalea aurantiaca TaxID=3056915 RepID=A0ABT7WAK6_9FLAO|nr:GNAT family N-acetyltransferase [Robiginitalea aurantiaca]MDM9629953.1 GNAT family N-acetyltransferase [Robiginitalea aurantiaca]
MQSPRLIPVDISHLELLKEIGIETFTDAFASANNPDDFQRYLDSAFDEKQLSLEINTPGSRFFFLNFEDEIAGYSKINTGQAQTEIRDEEGMEIERIYVRKDFRGSGLGSWMLRRFQKVARDEGKTYLWLGVWEENLNAIRFYKQHGFVTFGKHPYYVGSDRQMDWMMRLELTPQPNEP